MCVLKVHNEDTIGGHGWPSITEILISSHGSHFVINNLCTAAIMMISPFSVLFFFLMDMIKPCGEAMFQLINLLIGCFFVFLAGLYKKGHILFKLNRFIGFVWCCFFL